MSHRKRKHRQRSDPYYNNSNVNQYDPPASPSTTTTTRPDPSLFIVAHEADIIRGPQAARTADSLEYGVDVDGQGGSRVGEGLIKWECGAGGDVWVDRYDARLLLDALPTTESGTTTTTTTSAAPPSRPDSPSDGGWSDLPSDAEDTFFLTPEETADLHRTKRLRHLDALRTARLRALSPDPTTTPTFHTEEDPWGDSDEQPDEPQMDLMRRTASHVVRATNDAQLRARILAHHGADPRFAFLRGRWGRAWARAQADALRAVVAERESQKVRALGGLTGYGSSSSSSGSEGDDEEDKDDDGNDDVGAERDGPSQVLGKEALDVQVQLDQEAQLEPEPEPEELALRTAQEARRAKARLWAEKRRSERAPALATADSGAAQ